ncbi:LysO family transporter [Helicovermis profundi]|uniref:LysO family transporter n=1 Tax=Helicovermis profundi TaxID=3065157 RepID=A0AAU9EMT9_9FIRM|nr:LysO family transporter [Clostridia bacterium S502]
MLQIIIALVLGIIVGASFNLGDKIKKNISNLQTLGVVSLLFVMGISIGINPNIISELSNIGIKALVFALLTTIFSIIFVYFITQYIVKKNEEREN